MAGIGNRGGVGREGGSWELKRGWRGMGVEGFEKLGDWESTSRSSRFFLLNAAYN